ncbi:MAG TPA: hypothetical protein VFG87_05925 [Amycolatopsis sp.]|nr:hypothetical protein [Amycolatopsis sp.]
MTRRMRGGLTGVRPSGASTDGAVNCTPVGQVLVVHPGARPRPQAVVLAGAVAEDPEHTVVIVDLPPGAPLEFWHEAARRLRHRKGSLRLVLSGRSRDALVMTGQWLAERLGRPVVAPDGEPVLVQGGALFVPPDRGLGWVRFQRGREAVAESRHFPRPGWASPVVDRTWPTGPVAMAEPVPGGVWIRRVHDDPRQQRARRTLVSTLLGEHDELAVVLGYPGAPPLPLRDIAMFWASLPDSARSLVRFVGYGPVELPPGVPLGQALADLFEHNVIVYNGFPVVGGGARSVDPGGMFGWHPFAIQVGYQPRGGDGAVLPPTVLAHRAPLHGVREVAPAVYSFASDAVVEVVPCGLWLRPPDSPPESALVRSIPVDPAYPTVMFDTWPRAGERMHELVRLLVERLEPGVRASCRVLSAEAAVRSRGVLGTHATSSVDGELAVNSGSVPEIALPPRVVGTFELGPAVTLPGEHALPEPSLVDDSGQVVEVPAIEVEGAQWLSIDVADAADAASVAEQPGDDEPAARLAVPEPVDAARPVDEPVDDAPVAALGGDSLAGAAPAAGVLVDGPVAEERQLSSAPAASPFAGPDGAEAAGPVVPTEAPAAPEAVAVGDPVAAPVGTGAVPTPEIAPVDAPVAGPAPASVAASVAAAGEPTATPIAADSVGSGGPEPSGESSSARAISPAERAIVEASRPAPPPLAASLGLRLEAGEPELALLPVAELRIPAEPPMPAAPVASEVTGPEPASPAAEPGPAETARPADQPEQALDAPEQASDAPEQVVAAPPEVLVQPVPGAEACAVPPQRGLDRERDWLRRSVSDEFHAAAGAVSRVLSQIPGLRAGQMSEVVLADLVAARIYLASGCVRLEHAVRTATEGPHVPLARCAAAGLQRLPSYRGAAQLHLPATPAELDWFRGRRVVTEWAFLRATRQGGPVPDGEVEFRIWSMIGRRTALIDPADPDRVVFAPGSTFKVLRVEEEPRPVVLLRELSRSEIEADGRVNTARVPLDDVALGGLERAAREWSAADTTAMAIPPSALPGLCHRSAMGVAGGTERTSR